jgi:hypothetical protein
MLDRQFALVSLARFGEALVTFKKTDDIAKPGARASGDRPNVSPGQGTQPAPGPAEHPGGSCVGFFDGLLAGKEGAGEDGQQRRLVRHKALAAECSNESHLA